MFTPDGSFTRSFTVYVPSLYAWLGLGRGDVGLPSPKFHRQNIGVVVFATHLCRKFFGTDGSAYAFNFIGANCHTYTRSAQEYAEVARLIGN